MSKLEDYLYYEEKNPDLKIYCGDCLDILPLLPKVDLVVTDPPYGINFVPQRGTFEGIANDKQDEAKELWGGAIPELYRVLKDDTYAFLSIGWTEMDWVLPLLRNYFEVKACIVWYKNQFGIGYYTRPQHEFNLLCLKGKPKPPDNAPSDVWEIAKVYALEHSCQKPVELEEKAISLYSQQDGIILDPFLGSGTTLVACKELNRNGIGIEISEKYCAIAKERLKNTTPFLFQEDVFNTTAKQEELL